MHKLKKNELACETDLSFSKTNDLLFNITFENTNKNYLLNKLKEFFNVK